MRIIVPEPGEHVVVHMTPGSAVVAVETDKASALGVLVGDHDHTMSCQRIYPCRKCNWDFSCPDGECHS